MGDRQSMRHYQGASTVLLFTLLALFWAASGGTTLVAGLDYSKDPSRVNQQVGYQGDCDFGWAHAAVGMLEGQQADLGLLDAKKRIRPLSYQMLIDCLAPGCRQNIVHPEDIFPFVRNNGIALKSSYSKNGCKRRTGYEMRKTFSDDIKLRGHFDNKYLQDKLRSFGPLMVGVNSKLLKEVGINKCDEKGSVNHYVLLVGYGRYDGKDYYKYVSLQPRS